MTSEEIWKPVVGYEDKYEVSNLGRVRSLDHEVWGGRSFYKKRGRILSQNQTGGQHPRVNLGRDKTRLVHQLVMESFVGPAPEGMEVCHNNGQCSDNRAVNLRYDTRSSNRYDCVEHGTHPMATKTHCSNGHPLEYPNLDMNKLNKYNRRQCLACCRTAAKFFRHPELKPRYKELADDLYYKKYRVEGMEVMNV